MREKKICYWCKDAGLSEEEYTHEADEKGAFDKQGNWICDDCRDAAHEEMIAEQSAKEQYTKDTP